MRRRSHLWLAGALVAGAAGLPGQAWAGPNDGEGRSILRDTDRIYSTVAGEGDGASTVENPANLGYLEGVNGVVDIAWTDLESRRRGTGGGAMLGVPIRLRLGGITLDDHLFSVGLGYQYFSPIQPDSGVGEEDSPQSWDDPYSKVTLAVALPLQRWVRGLSLGMSYSRLISGRNFHAEGTNQFDVAASWWPIRFLALGMVARGVNVPQTGPDDNVIQSFVIDPEIAVRPLGTRVLELAAGVRYAPLIAGEPRFETFPAEPRGRLVIRGGPAQVFVSAERFSWFSPEPIGEPDQENAVRLTAGVGLDLPHVGAAMGMLAQAGGRRAFSADGTAARLRVSQERYPGLDVAPRRVTRIQLSAYGGEAGLWEVVQLLDRESERSGAVLLELEGLPYGWAQIEELREAILRHRLRGGNVYAYLEGGGLRQYFLASAASKIIAHPTDSLEIVGMRIEAFYFEQLLHKLGARAEFVRIAEYKAVPESFERMSASDPVGAQRMLLSTDIWNRVLRTVARERGHDPLVIKRWIDEAPHFPPRALREGIVDALAYPDELDARLEELEQHRVRIEKPPRQRRHRSTLGPLPRVAVLDISGDLYDSESFEIPLLGRKVAGSYTLTKTIEALRDDAGVRAIVVRCNTPGGSVSAADAIAHELDLTRQVKPVVVSMSSSCASGGYYIATAGQYIYTDATTVTGSIGIFFPKLDLSGTLEMLGVGMDRVDFGKHAGMRSWWKAYTVEERAAVFQDLQDSYSIFVGRVARARNMSLARVDDVARGRIWSGVRAVEVGLADAYGDLRSAIGRARTIAGLDPDEGEVVFYPEPPSVLENLRRVFGLDIPGPFGGQARSGSFSAAARSGSFLLPSPVLRALSRLPVNLWLADGPVPLALGEQTIEILD